MLRLQKDLQLWIEQEINEFSQNCGVASQWREPLVAVAAAKDELFAELKQVVGPEHQLPEDMLPGARSVICYFLPFSPAIANSNSESRRASLPWFRAYLETNQLIARINSRLKQELEKMGGKADFAAATHNFSREKLISFWSHKHAAYIAGLGRFGNHQMLITDRGSAGRIGSLITDLEITRDSRPDQDYCLNRAGEKCNRCLERCVFGALTAAGLDKEKCYQICLKNVDFFKSENADVCGKCTTLVPCALKNPVDA